jgi:hypothetical protein
MAIMIIVLALAGFARTYFLRPVLPPPTPALPTLTPLIHLHGILFTAWVFLFFIQVRLVRAGQVDLHRTLGMANVVVAALMVVIGTLTALHGVVRGVGPGGMDPRRFLIVPLASIALFAVFTALGLGARRDPQSHKRYMLLATLALLPPAIGRWVLLLGFGPPAILAVSTLCLVPLFVWDWKSRGRVHVVTCWGGLLLTLSGPLRIVLAKTGGWLTVSDWLVRLVT